MKKDIIRALITTAGVLFFGYFIVSLSDVNEIQEEQQQPIKQVTEQCTDEVTDIHPVIEKVEKIQKEREIEQTEQAEEVLAKQEEIQQLRQVEMTYYLKTGNPCANGEYPQEGMVAYSKEYIGCSVEIYTLDDVLIGTYRITDTGYGRTEANGKGTIQNGNCIDIFMDSHEHGLEFVKKYGTQVKIKIIEED